jgi:ribonucleoside-triphosphate reductase (thioredoxin)
MDDYQKFIATSRYSRWLDDEGRRETWEEICGRYVSWMYTHITKKSVDEPDHRDPLWAELYQSIVGMGIMPSMRCMMTAGPALDRTHVAGYNCAYLTVDSLRAFDETMYILMCGTGVGFSVEQKYVDQLPVVRQVPELYGASPIVVVRDSKEGWASALRQLIGYLYNGYTPGWDTSKVRPAGARLKTFGGRASGPTPLIELFTYVTEVCQKSRGRKLTSLECHDVMCKIAEVVVVGGVRRSAMISLSDLPNEEMRHAKHGSWWESNAQRGLSNNSAVYVGRPSVGEFLREWQSLYDSKSGERGFFNRAASNQQAARSGRRDVVGQDFGTNPCSEIILRPNQFCNLTEVVVRSDDDFGALERKVRLATTLGTFQSTLTKFKYLRDIWRKNTEEERLLGVSLTGILDHPILGRNGEGCEWLERLRDIAVETNAVLAKSLGIPQSVAVTCVKPSGTVSQLVDSASGIHPRWSPYYIRTVRGDIKDPLTTFLIDQGVPYEADRSAPSSTVVFSFPQRAPKGALCREDLTALEHLEIWRNVQEYWCEHKPSITVNVKEDEWVGVSSWVWDNFDILSGVAFLPYSEHTYQQAPYQEITEAEYHEWVTRMPKKIDWKLLEQYEKTDNTTGSQEYACAAGFCEIV